MKQQGESLTVWHLCSNRWNSAITEYALSSAKAFAMLGYRNVMSMLADSPGDQRSKNLGFDLIPFENFGTRQLAKVKKTFQQIAPDLIIVYGGPETFLTKFINQSNTMIFRFKGENLKTGFTKKIQQKFALSHIDATIVPSRKMFTELVSVGLDRVFPVTLGIDSTNYYFEGDTDSNQVIDFLIFGRFDPIKGHRDFMETFALLVKRNSKRKLRLNIVGEAANLSKKQLGEWGEELKLQDCELKIIDERIKDVAKLYRRMHVGVVSSVGSEVICRVAQEMLMCGLPVIVSGVGSLNEVLFPRAGISYDGIDMSERLKLIDKFVENLDSGVTERVQRASLAKEAFSIESMASEYNKVISELLECRKRNS